MPQLNLERLIDAINCHSEAMDRLTGATIESTAAVRALAAATDHLPEVSSDTPVDFDDDQVDPDALEKMIERAKTLFATPGLDGVYPPSLVGLLRAGGDEAAVNEAVYQLTERKWLELNHDGMLRKV